MIDVQQRLVMNISDLKKIIEQAEKEIAEHGLEVDGCPLSIVLSPFSGEYIWKVIY